MPSTATRSARRWCMHIRVLRISRKTSSRPSTMASSTSRRRPSVDSLYVDVIIRRYQAETGREAILEASGETFTALAARRRDERADGSAHPNSRNALRGEEARGGQMAAESGDA